MGIFLVGILKGDKNIEIAKNLKNAAKKLRLDDIIARVMFMLERVQKLTFINLLAGQRRCDFQKYWI